VTLTVWSDTVNEASGTTSVTVSLSEACSIDITVNLAFTGPATENTDYTLAKTIIIPAESLSASVTLSAVKDVLDEADEKVIISISSVTNGVEFDIQKKTVEIAIINDESF
jgi:hypothetical protein